MFKSKKSIYILLPVNLFIWSYLGFKIYDMLSEKNEVSEFSDTKTSIPEKTNTDTNSYNLKLNYEDPFLKSQPKATTILHAQKTNVSNVKKQLQAKSNLPVPAPQIVYLGLVQNKTSGNTTALISINGVSQLIKPGQLVNGILFKTLQKNQLIAFVGKEKIVVNK